MESSWFLEEYIKRDFLNIEECEIRSSRKLEIMYSLIVDLLLKHCCGVSISVLHIQEELE